MHAKVLTLLLRTVVATRPFGMTHALQPPWICIQLYTLKVKGGDRCHLLQHSGVCAITCKQSSNDHPTVGAVRPVVAYFLADSADASNEVLASDRLVLKPWRTACAAANAAEQRMI